LKGRVGVIPQQAERALGYRLVPLQIVRQPQCIDITKLGYKFSFVAEFS